MAAGRKKRVIGSLSAAALALLLFAAVFCVASNAAVIMPDRDKAVILKHAKTTELAR